MKYAQPAKGASPWSLKDKLRMLLWDYAWLLLCYFTPKPLNYWRLLVLRAFGASIAGTPFVHQRARVSHPWRLIIFNGASIGDRANLYSLDFITIESDATVAQESYLCTGAHDFDSPKMELVTEPIVVKSGAFIGLRAVVLAGVTIGENAIVGSCSLVTKDVSPDCVCVGNPARQLRKRNALRVS